MLGMDATYSGVSHISLTVTDLERSKQWYSRVLGWQELMAGEEAGTTFAVGAMAGNFLVGLREHVDGSGERFAPQRTGLDHLSLAVATREDLTAWEPRLTELGVTHSGTVDAPYGHVLSFKDPDGIALEFFALPAGG